MKNGSGIEELLDSLENLTDAAEDKKTKWGDVWSEIKKIGQIFKESRFPTVQDRQVNWKRFQSIIARVKESGERAREEIEKKVGKSEDHLKQLHSYARKATPSSGSDALLTIATGGLSAIVKIGIETVLGPLDERKMELQKCNEVLKEGWTYLSQNKGEMFGKHKSEAFEALKNASELLSAAWDMWKKEKQGAIGQFRAEKQADWKTRQAKRESWETRIRENITKLEDRLDRLENILDRRQNHLSKLEDMRDEARSDSYREQVDRWISEEQERISGIEGKIDQIKGWLSETKAKL
jgi:hypothetical protein